jgi:hypothetical protein
MGISDRYGRNGEPGDRNERNGGGEIQWGGWKEERRIPRESLATEQPVADIGSSPAVPENQEK